MELEVFNTIGGIARHTIPFFKTRVIQVPEFAAAQREETITKLRWLDGELADGRPFVAGERFSVADITGMAASMVLDFVGVDVPDELEHFRRWDAALRARPSWEA